MYLTVDKIYKFSLKLLSSKDIPSPELDARVIIAHHLGINRNDLFLHKTEKINPILIMQILISIFKRRRFMPVAYILGYKYFFQDKFFVSKKTLIPRADSEHLLYAVQAYYCNECQSYKNNEKSRFKEPKKIIDIGTGTGAIAVSLARLFPEALIQAIDIDISTLRKNIKRIGINNIELIRLDFLRYDLQRRHDLLFAGFDLIISNPPYLSKIDLEKLGNDARLYEPQKAFYGGEDGLNFYRKIAEFSIGKLNPDGLVVLEVDYKWEKVKDIFSAKGFKYIEMFRDYNGLERVLTIY